MTASYIAWQRFTVSGAFCSLCHAFCCLLHLPTQLYLFTRPHTPIYTYDDLVDFDSEKRADSTITIFKERNFYKLLRDVNRCKYQRFSETMGEFHIIIRENVDISPLMSQRDNELNLCELR